MREEGRCKVWAIRHIEASSKLAAIVAGECETGHWHNMGPFIDLEGGNWGGLAQGI